MPASSVWIDALFARLSARYGVAFQRQYSEIDPAAVKADWANTLDRMSADAIRAALENLPDRPPNAGQFRRLCLEMLPGEERRQFLALPAPKTPIPDHVRERLQAIKRTREATA